MIYMTYTIPNTFPNMGTPAGIYMPNTLPPITTVIQPAVVTATTTVPTKPSLGEAFKPKRAGKTKSHIIFVLDDSGSMQSCRDNTISGFNEYLDGQKLDSEKTEIETFVSLYKFDGSNVACTIDHVPVNEVAKLDRNSYNPRGGTNLLDAMGGVMMQINTKLANFKKKDRESVIITILTDGEENSSRTFRNEDIKVMVEKAEAKNWGFMFLGANINAFHAGSAMGFSVNNTMQFDTAGTTNTIRAASAMTSRMKGAYASGLDTSMTYESMGFTDQERTMSVTKDV
jgi:uncharacterized protein YegL